MPRRIGPLVYDGQPHKFPDAELGIAYQYNSDGLSLTIYVYDLGNKEIPDGANTAATCQQFEEAKQGVIQARYPNTVLKTEQLVRLAPPDDQPLAREAVFEFTINQRHAYSYVWITGVARQLHQAAFLGRRRPQGRGAGCAARDPHGVWRGGQTAPLRRAAPSEGKEKDNGTTITINSLGGSQDDVATAMMYLMFVSALADKDPGAAPPCGGAIIPSFRTELAVFQTDARRRTRRRSQRLGRNWWRSGMPDSSKNSSGWIGTRRAWGD